MYFEYYTPKITLSEAKNRGETKDQKNREEEKRKNVHKTTDIKIIDEKKEKSER